MTSLLKILFFTCALSLIQASDAPSKVEYDPLFDQKSNYSKFSGRVTDRDETASIIKISSESLNVKFFRAGDPVFFKVQNDTDKEYCEGFVRSIEDQYFVVFVKDLAPCFPGDNYFRRGTALVFHSDRLEKRVKEASIYRGTLIKKKQDYLSQLNGLNRNVYSFEERKVQVAAEFDKKILQLEQEKIKALDRMLNERNEFIRLQRELTYRLDNLDKELRFYQVERQDLQFDRWHMDQDYGYPVYEKPVEIRKEKRASTSF